MPSVPCIAPSMWVPTWRAVSMRCATIILICSDRVLDTDRDMHGATGMKRQFNIVGIVSYCSLTLQNENRVFRNGVDMRNVGFTRLKHDVVHIGVPGSDTRPNHETRILGNQ